MAARNVLLDRNCVCKVADFGLYYHNFKYGHGNAKKVSNTFGLLHFKQSTVATAELSISKVNMQIPLSSVFSGLRASEVDSARGPLWKYCKTFQQK